MKSAKCINCHITLDPVGKTFARFYLQNDASTKGAIQIAKLPDSKVLAIDPETKTIIANRLIYRDRLGTLHDVENSSVRPFAKNITQDPFFLGCIKEKTFLSLTKDPQKVGTQHKKLSDILISALIETGEAH